MEGVVVTDAQIRHYRALWAAARRVLRAQGLSSGDCELRRKEIHARVLGKPVSSLRLNNRQFDLVKGAFLAIAEPANLGAQIAADDGACIRSRHVVAGLCAEIGYDDDNLQGLIDRMQSEGRLREPDRARGDDAAAAFDIERDRDPVPRLTLADLDTPELERVIVALRLQVRRLEEQRAVAHATPSFAF